MDEPYTAERLRAMREQYEYVTPSVATNKHMRRSIRHRCGNCLISVTAQDSFCRGCGVHFDGTVKV
jgi:hypothetical protein